MKKNVKRKMPAPRNPYAMAAKKLRSAGTHDKPEKAKRREEKMMLKGLAGCSSKVEQSAFNRSAKIRFLPSRPDISANH